MIRDACAVQGLVQALQHQDPDVVEVAAEALGRIRSDEAVDGLAAGLRNAQGDVAEEIVEALSRIGGDRALDALIEVTGDASPAVRKAVIEALSGRRWSSDADPTPDPGEVDSRGLQELDGFAALRAIATTASSWRVLRIAGAEILTSGRG